MTPTQLPEILQGKIEMGKYLGKPFEPRLLTILCEASMFNPNFTYKATGTSGFGDNQKVSDVAVYEGAHPVGRVSVDSRYRRNDVDPVFTVQSENIEKRRNSVTSKHLKVAMKALKETFTPKPDDERARELNSIVDNKMNRIVRHATDHLEGAIRHAAHEVAVFLSDYDGASVKPSQLPPEVSAKLGSKWREYLSNVRISKSVQMAYATNTGACLRIEDDGSLSMWDMTTQTYSEHKSTYELPTYYQEKITILKLMEENQPVEHIGVKFEDYTHTNGVRRDMHYFFLVAGETYTTT